MPHSPEVLRSSQQKLSDYWMAIIAFAAREEYNPEYLAPMAQFRAVAEDETTITLDGPAELCDRSRVPATSSPPRPIGFWLEHQLPIWTGKRAVLVTG